MGQQNTKNSDDTFVALGSQSIRRGDIKRLYVDERCCGTGFKVVLKAFVAYVGYENDKDGELIEETLVKTETRADAERQLQSYIQQLNA